MDKADPRVEPRTRTTIRAQLRGDGPERETCILDVSSRGILATAARAPARGSIVELTVGRHSLVGQVKWASARRYGLILQERVSVSALIAGDGGSIRLRDSQAARRRSGGWMQGLRGNGSRLGRAFQFGVLALAGFGAALVLAGVAGEGLGSLQVAKQAMANAG